MNATAGSRGANGSSGILSRVPMGSARGGRVHEASPIRDVSVAAIGSRTLEEIRDTLEHELYDLTIPLWREDGVDWTYGGYATSRPVRPRDAAGWPYMDEAGEIVSTNKRLYHQGRIFWLYSYLYTHVQQDELFLKAAKTGFDFLTEHCMDETFSWYSEVTRQGELVSRSYAVLANVYTTLGLGEYYNATGSDRVRDVAVRSAYRIAEILLAPHYQAQGHSPYYEIIDSYREPGTRRLGLWLHYLNAMTSLLRYAEDPGLEKIARMCVRNILRRHFQPEMGLPFEFLQWDFTPYPGDYLSDDYLRAVDGFHSIEAAWMCMDEALRVGSPAMFREAMEMGRLLLEKTYLERDGAQGLVRFYWPDEPDSFARSAILGPYVMKEVFVFLLLALEHSGERWAAEWMDRTFSYSYETPIIFPLFDTLHNVRGLIFSIQILDRMIDRNGRVSSFLDEPEAAPGPRA